MKYCLIVAVFCGWILAYMAIASLLAINDSPLAVYLIGIALTAVGTGTSAAYISGTV